jgi:hypothetical protein
MIYAFLVIRSGSQVLDTLIHNLRANEMICCNPLLLPVYLAEPLVKASQERLSDSHQRLDELEESMGQHEYTGRPTGSPLDLDFLSTTRSLNWIGNKVGIDVLRLREMLLALQKLSLWESELNNGSQVTTSSNEERSVGYANSFQSLKALPVITTRLDFAKDSCTILLLEAEYEEKRVRALIQVVSSSSTPRLNHQRQF